MEDERFEFMRKLLVLCKEHGADLVGDDGSIVVHRREVLWKVLWIDDLAFVFSGMRGKPVEVGLKGFWDGEEHRVP